MFKCLYKFFCGSYILNLFRGGVVLGSVVLLMLAQIFPYIYDKELSATKAKIKIEIAYAEIEDKLFKENSIEDGRAFRRLDPEYSRKKIHDIHCWEMGKLEAECEIAKHECKLFFGYINVFNKFISIFGVIAAVLCFFTLPFLMGQKKIDH